MFIIKAMKRNNISKEKSEKLDGLYREAMKLPSTFGVYIMHDKNDSIIYVGKSKSLRSRVSQYFADTAHAVKTERMVSSVERFETIVCETEMEALTLEASLIKRHEPRYNIKLKDAKAYPYIKVDMRADFPRLSMTRKRGAEKSTEALYFGPYSSAAAVRDILTSMERIFSLPTCKYEFPRDIGRVGSCVYDQMGRCSGICRGRITSEEYKEHLKGVVSVLRGDIRGAVCALRERMTEYAEAENYEAAARCRDSIASLERLKERQNVVASPETERDVIAYHEDGDGICSSAALLVIRGGAVADKQSFDFGADRLLLSDSVSEEDGMVEFLTVLYSSREYVPHEVLVSFDLSDENRALVSEYLTQRAGHRVTVRTPERGEGRRLVHLALENARHSAELYKSRAKSDLDVLVKLASLLCLETVPERIECYDISNLGAEHITAGMIVAENGKFKKSAYRLFSIEGKNAPDDYAAMSEALRRRVAHTEWGDMPDLILLDGGKGHVGVVRALFRELGVDIPVFGMVKDEHHKSRAIAGDSEEISIAREQAVFQFIYRLSEEVHRFTVSSMKRAKSKTLSRSSLTAVEGIGPKKAKALLAHFGTMTALRAATPEEIGDVSGISEKNAAAVYGFLHKNDERKKLK